MTVGSFPDKSDQVSWRRKSLVSCLGFLQYSERSTSGLMLALGCLFSRLWSITNVLKLNTIKSLIEYIKTQDILVIHQAEGETCDCITTKKKKIQDKPIWSSNLTSMNNSERFTGQSGVKRKLNFCRFQLFGVLWLFLLCLLFSPQHRVLASCFHTPKKNLQSKTVVWTWTRFTGLVV